MRNCQTFFSKWLQYFAFTSAMYKSFICILIRTCHFYFLVFCRWSWFEAVFIALLIYVSLKTNEFKDFPISCAIHVAPLVVFIQICLVFFPIRSFVFQLLNYKYLCHLIGVFRRFVCNMIINIFNFKKYCLAIYFLFRSALFLFLFFCLYLLGVTSHSPGLVARRVLASPLKYKAFLLYEGRVWGLSQSPSDSSLLLFVCLCPQKDPQVYGLASLSPEQPVKACFQGIRVV